MFGNFEIEQCAFNPKKNIMHVDIKLNMELPEPTLGLEQAEELIWTILPAAYSEEYDYMFNKYAAYYKKTFTYGIHFTDTPKNIEWTVV